MARHQAADGGHSLQIWRVAAYILNKQLRTVDGVVLQLGGWAGANNPPGTWNVRSLYRIGSLKTVARELEKCKLDLVGVQEVRWEKGGPERAEDYTFFYGQRNGDHQLGTGFFIQKRNVSAVRRVQFISDKLYIILRDRWCNIIVLNVHALCEDKGDDVKDSFHDKLWCFLCFVGRI
jgi:hypothetical protein